MNKAKYTRENSAFKHKFELYQEFNLTDFETGIITGYSNANGNDHDHNKNLYQVFEKRYENLLVGNSYFHKSIVYIYRIVAARDVLILKIDKKKDLIEINPDAYLYFGQLDKYQNNRRFDAIVNRLISDARAIGLAKKDIGPASARIKRPAAINWDLVFTSQEQLIKYCLKLEKNGVDKQSIKEFMEDKIKNYGKNNI